ncbi:MAG TPA: DEAD/DEAH box helicase [Candidatus Aquicultor sp.]|jgi:DEAD/DEAH box helicase domain-containing protein
MDEITNFLHYIEHKSEYDGQITHQRILAPVPANHAEPENQLSPEMRERLQAIGIDALYSHQARAYDLVKDGNNVLAVSGTASGKSLCYNLPVLEAMLTDKKARALYLYPTKALAQDQLRALGELEFPGMIATYDGDTPREARSDIKRNASVVLSNPDMLHIGILPYHKQWATFFLNLRFVVIDEVHVLRGIFGSNVAQVIRRLRRICHHYGSHPQFIMASATIANPQEHAERLTGLDVRVVADDGAPRGQKNWVFWNPPYIDDSHAKRKSGNWEATWLLSELSKEYFRTIAFSKSRKVAELVLNYTRRNLLGRPDIAQRVASYRAGYLPGQRRAIEERLFSGELLGVSTTNALELGIDVGALDAAIMNGFPGTISSAWQQAGRAGRTVGESLAVLIAGDDPLDQYYINHPEYFFGRTFEEAVIDLDNTKIMGKHLRCAAYELPLTVADRHYFGESFEVVVYGLIASGDLKERKGSFYVGRIGFPARDVNIRSASQSMYEIVDEGTGQLLGTTEAARAFHEIHPGAVYLHQGESYAVRALDLEEKMAFVTKASGDYYTEPREDTEVAVLCELESRPIGPSGRAEISFGTVEVTSHVIAYQKKALTGEVLGMEELKLPPQKFQTEALWFTVSDDIVNGLDMDDADLAGGIHAVEHAAIALLPMFAMCDRWDIGGVSTPYHYYTDQATIFIYDGFEGGIGIAKRGFTVAEEHLKRTLEAIIQCKCEAGNGCPSCIQSPKCGNWNEPLNKRESIRILKEILKKS